MLSSELSVSGNTVAGGGSHHGAAGPRLGLLSQFLKISFPMMFDSWLTLPLTNCFCIAYDAV